MTEKIMKIKTIELNLEEELLEKVKAVAEIYNTDFTKFLTTTIKGEVDRIVDQIRKELPLSFWF